MKNLLSLIFLTFSLSIYSNPVVIPIDISVKNIAAPETSSATITINEGSTNTINLADYTSGSPTSYSIVTNPVQKAVDNGFLDFGNGTYQYVHNGSEAPTDSFTFKATNSDGDSNTSTITFKVTNVNDAPTSTGTSVTLNEGAESIFSLSYSDSDTTTDQIAFTIATQPTNGNIIDLGSGSIRYIHNGGETTSDSFREFTFWKCYCNY